MQQEILKKLRNELRERGVDAFLVTSHSNVQYISHFTGSNKTLFLTQKKCFLLTDSRYHLRARKEIPQKSGIDILEVQDKEKTLQKISKNTKQIGFEAADMTVARLKRYQGFFKGKKLKAQEDFVENIRMIKNKEEIKKLQKACRILSEIFKDLQKEIKPGIRERDLAWKVRELAYKKGAEDIAFEPIIAFGKNSALPHHKSGDTKLKAADSILIDIGIKYQGYCSDMTRTLFPAEKNLKLKIKNLKFHEVYQAVKEAKEAAEKIAKPGIKLKKLDEAARKVLKKYKLDKYFTHGLGHGVGMDIHEKPTLSPISKDILYENMVFTIEPGVYIPGKGGVRLEDTYVYQKNRAVPLTKIPL